MRPAAPFARAGAFPCRIKSLSRRARQRRPLRGVGATMNFFRRGSGGVPIPALILASERYG
jgi:hypothetical protein